MIEFKNVYKTYPNGFTALKNINLQIEQGEFVAIIGLSGAGKSTILRCINRMHDISKGELTVDGVTVDSLRGKELRRYRRKVGMIFQSFNLVSRSTAIKNVLTADVPDMPFFRVLLGIFTKKQKMRALESLDKVGILDKAYTRCDQLSGGQQQRVALARTLNQNPKIILADEPTGALDSKSTDELLRLFTEVNALGQTILMVTHSVKAASSAKRVLFIKDGEVFHQIYRGADTDSQLYQKISETLTLLATGGERK
jgi:phosphonate transport system ATP-binding protein